MTWGDSIEINHSACNIKLAYSSLANTDRKLTKQMTNTRFDNRTHVSLRKEPRCRQLDNASSRWQQRMLYKSMCLLQAQCCALTNTPRSLRGIYEATSGVHQLPSTQSWLTFGELVHIKCHLYPQGMFRNC